MVIDELCSECGGSKHVRTKTGWRRCSKCSTRVADSLFIKLNIKCGEPSYPPSLEVLSPVPLKDLSCTGEYHDFRKMVWRSLVYYSTLGDLRYEYIDAYRLVEIFLGQDSIYDRVRDLESLDLVVLVLGVSDVPNRMLPALVCQLLTLRKMSGHPTWVFSSKTGAPLRNAYGSNEMVDLLGDIKASVYELVGHSPSSAKSSIATES